MRRGYRLWTPDEDERLSRIYNHAALPALAQQFKRTENAISIRACKLGFAKPKSGRADVSEPSEAIDRKLALIDRLKRKPGWAA